MKFRIGKMPTKEYRYQNLIDLLMDGNGLYDLEKEAVNSLRQRLYKLDKHPQIFKQEDGLYSLGIKG